MATAYNSTIKLYTKVPLVKGGTEVLYLSQGAAEGALAGFLKATYNEYYFVRDNRRAVQIDATFGDCEGVNYISFSNKSHGGKIFFGFVDEIVYINDNCTEIRFTIDPFPTYLGDTEERDDVFVVRNTYRSPTRNSNFITDFVPPSIKKQYNKVASWQSNQLTRGICYFAGGYIVIGQGHLNMGGTGINVSVMTADICEDIQERGGVIIGAYMDPWNNGPEWEQAYIPQSDITFNPFVGGTDTGKLNTGVYKDLLLITSTETKQYEIEDFSNPENISFGALWCHIPSPMFFLYPKNYRGVDANVGEGVTIKVPSLPITANSTYTPAQRLSDTKNTIVGALGGAVAGAAYGGAVGAAAGGVLGLASGLLNQQYNEVAQQFKAPRVLSNGEPMLAADGRIHADFVVASPSPFDKVMIKDYFDYYGYAVNELWSKDRVNTDEDAFLQTSSEFLTGSEADLELNARIMAGIKIKKNF